MNPQRSKECFSNRRILAELGAKIVVVRTSMPNEGAAAMDEAHCQASHGRLQVRLGEGSGVLMERPSRHRRQHPYVPGNIRWNNIVRLQSREQCQGGRHRALITTGPDGQGQGNL